MLLPEAFSRLRIHQNEYVCGRHLGLIGPDRDPTGAGEFTTLPRPLSAGMGIGDAPSDHQLFNIVSTSTWTCCPGSTKSQRAT